MGFALSQKTKSHLQVGTEVRSCFSVATTNLTSVCSDFNTWGEVLQKCLGITRAATCTTTLFLTRKLCFKNTSNRKFRLWMKLNILEPEQSSLNLWVSTLEIIVCTRACKCISTISSSLRCRRLRLLATKLSKPNFRHSLYSYQRWISLRNRVSKELIYLLSLYFS